MHRHMVLRRNNTCDVSTSGRIMGKNEPWRVSGDPGEKVQSLIPVRNYPTSNGGSVNETLVIIPLGFHRIRMQDR